MTTTIAPDSLKLVLDTDILTDWRYQRSHTMQDVRDYLARFNVYPQLTAMTVFEARFGIENKAVGYGVATRNQRDFELIGRNLPPYVPVLYLAIWKS
jgi:hypothetical protein